jgi:hypothetical protein
MNAVDTAATSMDATISILLRSAIKTLLQK